MLNDGRVHTIDGASLFVTIGAGAVRHRGSPCLQLAGFRRFRGLPMAVQQATVSGGLWSVDFTPSSQGEGIRIEAVGVSPSGPDLRSCGSSTTSSTTTRTATPVQRRLQRRQRIGPSRHRGCLVDGLDANCDGLNDFDADGDVSSDRSAARTATTTPTSPKPHRGAPQRHRRRPRRQYLRLILVAEDRDDHGDARRALP